MGASDISLQINLSGGDVPYAARTVPRLVAAHRPHVREAFAIVDCCRPQKTQMVDPDVKFPAAVFEERVDAISTIAEDLKRSGVLDRVVYVRPGDRRIRALLKRYVGPVVRETHDCYGVGLVSYLYGFDEAATRFLVHYDADMLLYQADGYDWIAEALDRLRADPAAISATPRVSAPFAEARGVPDAPSLQASDPPPPGRDGAWQVGWFSARCFLIDLERLQSWLPLLRLSDPRVFGEVVARKVLERRYPPPTEVLIFCRARRLGSYRIDLMTEDAFVIHPNDKGPRFLRLLPELLERIGAGDVPVEQRGWENIVLDAWEQEREARVHA